MADSSEIHCWYGRFAGNILPTWRLSHSYCPIWRKCRTYFFQNGNTCRIYIFRHGDTCRALIFRHGESCRTFIFRHGDTYRTLIFRHGGDARRIFILRHSNPCRTFIFRHEQAVMSTGFPTIFCLKELSFCHKLKFFNLYISVTGWCKPLIFQT